MHKSNIILEPYNCYNFEQIVKYFKQVFIQNKEKYTNCKEVCSTKKVEILTIFVPVTI